MPEETTAHAHDHDLGPKVSSRGGAASFIAAGDLLKALAAPLRAHLVSLLDEHGPLCVHELVESLDVAQPLVSQHLRVLRSAGVVVGDRHGREVRYRLADDHIAHIVADAITHAQEHLHRH
ncbi:helix-turn-helix transcriptional regulator [Blastococcus sp. Marseille-P5729]|uniref:ArsR/SmtB family transcription factor n=1 Tax=Blastococcus sp. Marseille-P5729 TaxID=2086582 RepID=UPI0018FE7A2D|nr:metalloregulator ArsR/SmtB family transcription factor [Blastococcus sp. Marseille-P5729]